MKGLVNNMFSAVTVKNLVSVDECEYIVRVAASVEPWESGGNLFWDNRCLNAINIYKNINTEVGELLFDIRARIKSSIEAEYRLEVPVYPDLLQVVRWLPGMKQGPHADDMKNTENNERFHHRDYGAVLYLNNEYSGGKTYYPKFNTEVSPEIGMLAVHPGDEEHLHGVTEVADGVRYTLASFWTLDEKHFDGWSLS